MGMEVSITFDPARTYEEADNNGNVSTYSQLQAYTIEIPSASGPDVVVMAFVPPEDQSMSESGVYNDPLLRAKVNEGYEFHVIADSRGDLQSVLMTSHDWNRYQAGLSSFAEAARTSPSRYQPTAASSVMGLFRPQAQAGTGGAAAPRVFRPIANDRMAGMGVSVSYSAGSYRDAEINYSVYEARTPAARSALMNAGYVEVQVKTFDGDREMRVPRFMTPADARIYNETNRP